MRKAYGYRTFRITELALYHVLGKLPEPVLLQYAGLKDFVAMPSVEEQRGIAEGLSEEELAIFDILTKPELVLTKVEEAEVKKLCRQLLV